MSQVAPGKNGAREVEIPAREVTLSGELNIPRNAAGVVLFAHGSGSSRHSPRNGYVARIIRNAGVGTLLFDLLTRDEEAIDAYTRHLRFDIGLLADRLVNATYWLIGEFDHLRAGYFGASTGAAAALVAAAQLGEIAGAGVSRGDRDAHLAAQLGEIAGAVVSRGGRPDLAADSLSLVKAPTLLIVGGLDYPVIDMNRQAYSLLRCEKEIEIVPGATHLFEEPGTLDQVAHLAAEWFQTHLHSSRRSAKEQEMAGEYVEVKR